MSGREGERMMRDVAGLERALRAIGELATHAYAADPHRPRAAVLGIIRDTAQLVLAVPQPPTLEQLLGELTTFAAQAQARYEREALAALAGDPEFADGHYTPEGRVWLALEYSPGAHEWTCGWKIQVDEPDEWAFTPASGRTPVEAVVTAVQEVCDAKAT
jgi:hypothetical protein